MSPAERAAALALGDPYFEYLNVSRWEMPFRVVQAMLREIMFHPRRGCTIHFSTVERRVASYPWFTQEDEVPRLEATLRVAETRAEKAEAERDKARRSLFDARRMVCWWAAVCGDKFHPPQHMAYIMHEAQYATDNPSAPESSRVSAHEATIASLSAEREAAINTGMILAEKLRATEAERDEARANYSTLSAKHHDAEKSLAAFVRDCPTFIARAEKAERERDWALIQLQAAQDAARLISECLHEAAVKAEATIASRDTEIAELKRRFVELANASRECLEAANYDYGASSPFVILNAILSAIPGGQQP